MDYLHYIDYLKEEKARRTERNPSYSLRAFARSIELSPGFLNLLLQKKRSLSFERAQEIAKKINWSIEKNHAFLELVKTQALRQEKLEPPSKIFSVLFSP